MTRIYIDAELTVNSTLDLPDDAAHHVARVLRMRTGETISTFNGQGGEYLATLDQISKSSVTANITEFDPTDRESPLAITLAQGISRGDKMDFTIQKAVELGVSHIAPITTQRGNVHLDEKRWTKKQAHWQKIIISACEQCGRNRLPTLAPVENLQTWASHDQAALKLVLDPHSEHALSTQFADAEAPQSVSFVIGPEGGLSPDEITQLKNLGFLGIRLGPRVFRTETAALAVIAMLQTRFGDFA